MDPRLATGAWVSALLRRASAEGAFGTVLRKGDPTAGAVILVIRARSGETRALARIGGAEKPRWEVAASSPAGESEAVDKYLTAQLRYDDDLWAVELVTDDIKRLVDETIVER